MKSLVLLFIIINFSNCVITDAIDDLFSEECEGIRLVQDEGDKAYTNSDLEKAVEENIECEELKYFKLTMGDHEGGLEMNITTLQPISKMKNLQKITNYLDLDSTKISTLNGLEKIKSIGSIYIGNNPYLENIDGLLGLEKVGNMGKNWDFSLFFECNKINNLDGLKNLKVVEGNLKITECYLENIDGISNLGEIGGVKEIITTEDSVACNYECDY